MCSPLSRSVVSLFFFNDTATTEIYTLSLHDALPIAAIGALGLLLAHIGQADAAGSIERAIRDGLRSEEHTSELQSHVNLVCRLLLEKKREHRYDRNSGYGWKRS